MNAKCPDSDIRILYMGIMLRAETVSGTDPMPVRNPVVAFIQVGRQNQETGVSREVKGTHLKHLLL